MLVGNTQLIAGTAADIPAVLELLRKEGIEPEQNPDVYVRTYAHFGIDEARELRERAATKALDNRRAFVLAMPGMTNEAQNALLKTLEEVPGDALFLFVLPAPEALLSTVRSRAQLLSLSYKIEHGQISTIDPTSFLRAVPAQRLDMLKPLFEKDEDDRRDLASVITFLSSLERMLESRRPLSIGGLEAIYRARKYADDKGSLLKPLLEQVALLLPVLS